MNHHAIADFWACYQKLPVEIQRLADAKYALLRVDPRHPSLHFKKVGRLWSVRVGIGYRALAIESDDGPIWFWIGPHAEYDRIIDGA
jgi:hypothetical protein